jgi:hypothetical protein
MKNLGTVTNPLDIARLEDAGSGPQGFQGFQGFQGHQGFQGVAGLQGLQGLQGFQGNQGITGLQGLTNSDWATVSASKYTAAPPSTSTLTMSDTNDFVVGSAVGYTIGGTTYYGTVTAITPIRYLPLRVRR